MTSGAGAIFAGAAALALAGCISSGGSRPVAPPRAAAAPAHDVATARVGGTQIPLGPATARRARDMADADLPARSAASQPADTAGGPLSLVLSGPDLPLTLDHCRNDLPFVNRPRRFAFAVRDDEAALAALPPGTAITFTASNGEILGDAAYAVPDSPEPPSTWVYPVTVRSDAVQDDRGTCRDATPQGQLVVRIETPDGHVTDQVLPLND